MKIKLSKQQIDSILEDPQKAQETGVKTNDPLWVIILKIVFYAMGLFLGGAATSSAACIMM